MTAEVAVAEAAALVAGVRAVSTREILLTARMRVRGRCCVRRHGWGSRRAWDSRTF